MPTPWNVGTFFERAAEDGLEGVVGLWFLLRAAKAVGSRIDLMWGAGEKHPRFAIRTTRRNDGELISGWADGTIGVQVGNLRELLGSDSREVEYLFITMGHEDLLTISEPLVPAVLLENPLVQARMEALIERIASLGDGRKVHKPRLYSLASYFGGRGKGEEEPEAPPAPTPSPA